MRAPKAATLASASRARSRIACPRFHMFIDIGARVILVNTKRLAREEGRHTDKRETTLQCGIFEHRTTSPCAKRYTDRIRTSTSTHKHAADARTQRLVGIHSTSAARTNWLRALVDIPHTHTACVDKHTAYGVHGRSRPAPLSWRRQASHTATWAPRSASPPHMKHLLRSSARPVSPSAACAQPCAYVIVYVGVQECALACACCLVTPSLPIARMCTQPHSLCLPTPPPLLPSPLVRKSGRSLIPRSLCNAMMLHSAPCRWATAVATSPTIWDEELARKALWPECPAHPLRGTR